MARAFRQQKKAIKRTLKENKGKTVTITNVPTWQASKVTGRYNKPTGRTTTVRASKPSGKVKAVRAAGGAALVYGAVKTYSGFGHALVGDSRGGLKRAGVGIAATVAGGHAAKKASNLHSSNMRSQPQVKMSYGTAGKADVHSSANRKNTVAKTKTMGRVPKKR